MHDHNEETEAMLTKQQTENSLKNESSRDENSHSSSENIQEGHESCPHAGENTEKNTSTLPPSIDKTPTQEKSKLFDKPIPPLEPPSQLPDGCYSEKETFIPEQSTLLEKKSSRLEESELPSPESEKQNSESGFYLEKETSISEQSALLEKISSHVEESELRPTEGDKQNLGSENSALLEKKSSLVEESELRPPEGDKQTENVVFTPPDGGYGWVVLAASFTANMWIIGWFTTYQNIKNGK